MDEKVIIIAEAGVNHNGDLVLAKQLIDFADAAGADYVKFQTFKTEKNISKKAPKASYQMLNTDAGETQFDMVKKLELSDDDHLKLLDHCRKKNVKFLSTPFDAESISFLKKIGVTTGKIPSGEIVNLPYLRQMAAAFPKIILSTGMSTREEIRNAMSILLAAGTLQENITVLHCNTEYPTPMNDVNLRAMVSLRRDLNVAIGYSDHTQGIEVPIAAVALGATVIEKHFTISRTMEGPDHKASLEPEELSHMVSSIRNIERALGSSTKEPSASEIKNRAIARKSIVAAIPIKKGQLLTGENLGTKRPGNGISPMEWDNVIGKIAIKDFDTDEMIIL